MKIYKYTSIETALKILQTGYLRLTNPYCFNDPFDNDVIIDKDDFDKAISIVKDFTGLTMRLEQILDPNISNAKKNDPLFPEAMNEYRTNVEKLRAHPRFISSLDFPIMCRLLSVDENLLDKKTNEYVERFRALILQTIQNTKNDALATCFSKNHDSILMWSHYGESHTGVCFEFDRPNTNDFVDMIYQEERPKLKISELIAFISAKNIVKDRYNHHLDQKLTMDVIKPFCVKSMGWSYEQEIRCLILKNSKNAIFNEKDKQYYYKMLLPTKIYIGCRASGKEMDEIIKIAKKNKIPYRFLKQDKDSFKLKIK